MYAFCKLRLASDPTPCDKKVTQNTLVLIRKRLSLLQAKMFLRYRGCINWNGYATTNCWEPGMPGPTLNSHTLSNQWYRLYETSITMVQSYTEKYHNFVAVYIIRRSARDLQYLIQILTWLAVKNTAFYKLHVAASLPHWFLYICMS